MLLHVNRELAYTVLAFWLEVAHPGTPASPRVGAPNMQRAFVGVVVVVVVVAAAAAVVPTPWISDGELIRHWLTSSGVFAVVILQVY